MLPLPYDRCTLSSKSFQAFIIFGCPSLNYRAHFSIRIGLDVQR
jgi:hypothetical protein